MDFLQIIAKVIIACLFFLAGYLYGRAKEREFFIRGQIALMSDQIDRHLMDYLRDKNH